MTKRLEFTAKTKVQACMRYYPDVQGMIGDAKLTEARAKELLPEIFAKIKCVGLFEIKTDGRCERHPEQVDHIMRCEIKPDNSVENARPLCGHCHQIKTSRDAFDAAKGRRIRKETKKSQGKALRKGQGIKTSRKIPPRGFPSKEKRDEAKQWKRRADDTRQTDRDRPATAARGE